MHKRYAVLTSDVLGVQFEYFEHQYEAENWAELFDGSLISLDGRTDAAEAIRAQRIEKGISRYERRERKNIEI